MKLIKKVKYNFVIIIGFALTYSNSFSQISVNRKDTLKANKSIYTFIIKSDKNKFDPQYFSQKIQSQLKKYNLTIYKTKEVSSGEFYFTTEYLGKSFLKDSHEVYNYNLDKHIPKIPNFERIDFRKNLNN